LSCPVLICCRIYEGRTVYSIILRLSSECPLLLRDPATSPISFATSLTSPSLGRHPSAA
jgi:hypothetical protein